MIKQYVSRAPIWLLGVVFVALSSCATEIADTNRTTLPAKVSPTNTVTPITVVATDPPAADPVAVSTNDVALTVDGVSEAKGTQTPTANHEVVLRNNCPTLASSGVSMEGNVLFNTGKMLPTAPTDYLEMEAPGVWAISSASLSPKQVNEDLSDGLVSPDGTMLFHISRMDGTATEANFIDLRSGGTISIEFSPEPGLFTTTTWLRDGRVRHEIVTEMVGGESNNRRSVTFTPAPHISVSTGPTGETRQTFIFDPFTGQVQEFLERFDLPDMAFYPSEIAHGIPSGYASIDPDRELVLYTASRNSDSATEVRLLDLQTGNLLWQRVTDFIPVATVEWEANGQQVLFLLHERQEGSDNSRYRIVSLTRDGEEEFLLQPVSGHDELSLTTLTRSPSGRYLFYTMIDSTGITHGYIFDLETREVRELCGSGVNLVTDFQKEVEGLWLPNEQFIYRVLVEEGNQLAHSLRVLDIPIWTAQTLIESGPGYGINILGWTPLEFLER